MEQEENKTQGTPENDLGKFKSVAALMEAYNSLQAEFTRRSQRLKELEEKPKEDLYESVMRDEGVKGKIIEEYLSSLRRSPLAMPEGGSVAAPARKPKSLQEAGRLAIQYFKGV